MTYTLELYLDHQWRDVEVLLSDTAIMVEYLHRGFKPTDNSIKAKLIPTEQLLNYLRGVPKTVDVPARLKNGNDVLFYGHLRKNFKISKTQRLEPVEFEIVSPTAQLKRKIRTPLFLRNIKVCDSSDVANSAFHRIMFHAGLTAEHDIAPSLPLLPSILPYLKVDVGDDYRSVIEDLLFSYGYILDFDLEGKAVLLNLFPEYVPSANAFTGANMLDQVQQIKAEEENTVVEIRWKKIAHRSNELVFSDSTNASSAHSCNIIVPPLQYLGSEEGNDTWFAEFGVEGKEFIAAYDATLDTEMDSDFAVEVWEPTATRSRLSIKNTNTAFERQIRKLDIRAGAIVLDSLNVSRVMNADTDSVFEFESDYIFAKDAADALAAKVAQYYKFADFRYKLRSKSDYPMGGFVVVSDTGLGTSNGRIVRKQRDLHTGIISYEVEGVTEYSAVASEFDHIVPYTPRPRTDVDTSDFVTHDELGDLSGLTQYVALYTRSVSPPTTPASEQAPAGWFRTIPYGDDPVWMVGANITGAGEVVGGWSAPTQFAGLNAVYASFTNESHIVPTDINGENGDYSGAQTDIVIYEGGVESTALWTIGVVWGTGVEGVLLNNTVTVTQLTERVGFVDIVATRTRRQPIVKRFTLSQARDGGTLQPVYRLGVSSTVIQVYPTGIYHPPLSDIVIRAERVASGAEPELFPAIFRIKANNILQYESSEPEQTYTWPEPSSSLDPGEEVLPGEDQLTQISNPWLGTEDVVVAVVELWSTDLTIRYDVQSISFVKDVGFKLEDIRSDVLQNLSEYVPRYRGRYLDSLPTTYYPGDWFLIYGEDDTPYVRGVYVVNPDLSTRRITGDTSADAMYMSTAMADVLWVVNSTFFGELTDYGNITFISNLATNSIFTNSLRIGVGNVDGLENIGDMAFEDAVEISRLGSTLIDGGFIRTELLDVQHIMGESAVFRGHLEAASGLFNGSIESGPLNLNISPPVTSSRSTNGRTVVSFIDELLSHGVLQGAYTCSGSYNGQTVDRIQFSIGAPTTHKTAQRAETWFIESVWYPGWSTYLGNGEYLTYPAGWLYYNSKQNWASHVRRYPYTLVMTRGSVEVTRVTGTSEQGSHWTKEGASEIVSSTSNTSTTTAPVPTTAITTAVVAPALSDGSLSFTNNAFTMRLENLPGYSSSLPRWTVYLAADGDGNYDVKVKG